MTETLCQVAEAERCGCRVRGFGTAATLIPKAGEVLNIAYALGFIRETVEDWATDEDRERGDPDGLEGADPAEDSFGSWEYENVAQELVAREAEIEEDSLTHVFLFCP